MQKCKNEGFQDWLETCREIGFEPADVKDNENEYWFEDEDGFKFAYYDREKKFGFVSLDEVAVIYQLRDENGILHANRKTKV